MERDDESTPAEDELDDVLEDRIFDERKLAARGDEPRSLGKR